MVKPFSPKEYFEAGLDKLASSNSWNKEETDILLYLCEKFNLSFPIIADRFSLFLKEKYDKKLRDELENQRKNRSKREMKAQYKEEVYIDQMDESMFERTIYDCKWRYYEVA